LEERKRRKRENEVSDNNCKDRSDHSYGPETEVTYQGNRQPPRREAPSVGARIDRVAGDTGMTQMSGPTLFLEPMTRIGGKRYSGFPSTNSPVNTPTYGAAPKGELIGWRPSSAAQPATPKTRAVATATHVTAISNLGERLMAPNIPVNRWRAGRREALPTGLRRKR
jgi:hypothetical protein